MITALSLSLLLGGISCNSKKENKVLTREITFTKEGELEVRSTPNDSLLVKLDIEIAESDYETRTGLMYRKGMEPKEAMLFIFPEDTMKAFYMKNTEFPLDIIFINSNMEVVNIHKNTVPFSETSLSSGAPARYVLEVNAGLTDQWELKPGDKISFERLSQ